MTKRCVFLRTLLLGFLAMSQSSVFAQDCILSVNRIACPGKEVEMLRPYRGENPTTVKKYARDEVECRKIAAREAKIIRLKVISEKIVSIRFKGADLGTVSDRRKCK